MLIQRCIALASRCPTRPAARLVTRLLILFRYYREADAMLERSLAAYPGDPILLTLHALGAHRTCRHSEAVERWRRRLDVGPSTARPWWGVANSLRALGRQSEASEITREALRRFPNVPRIIEEAAFAADYRLDFEEAAQLWHRLIVRYKTKPTWWQQYTSNLIMLGRLDEAEVLITRARRRYPDHEGLLVNTGLLAAERGDWPTAVQVMAGYHAGAPDDPNARELLGRILHRRNLATAVDASGPVALAPVDVGRVDDEAARALLLNFESLGRDCEFGLLQRRYGAEPIGLLRWGGTSIPGLLLALAYQFEGLGDPSHLQLRVDPESKLYSVVDPRFDFEMHTFMFVSQIDADAILLKMCKTIRFLKEKFLGDLGTAHKVFVYKDPECTRDLVVALHAALRRCGPAHLLWVLPVDAEPAAAFDERRPGEICKMDDGLFAGFLSRHAGVDGVWDIQFEEWLALCDRMAAVTRAPEPSGLRIASETCRSSVA